MNRHKQRSFDCSLLCCTWAISKSLPQGPILLWHLSPILFDSGSVSVPEAQAITLHQALAGYVPGINRIVITGYTDTSGTVEANQRLSELRAETVARELVKLGALWADIEFSGHGELRLVRPTPDGAAEAHNRRVTIDVRMPRPPR